MPLAEDCRHSCFQMLWKKYCHLILIRKPNPDARILSHLSLMKLFVQSATQIHKRTQHRDLLEQLCPMELFCDDGNVLFAR